MSERMGLILELILQERFLKQSCGFEKHLIVSIEAYYLLKNLMNIFSEFRDLSRENSKFLRKFLIFEFFNRDNKYDQGTYREPYSTNQTR